MNQRYLKHINTLFVVLPMSFIMALVSHAKNQAFTQGWYKQLFTAWSLMLPIAYVSAFFIIPPAKKMAEKVCRKNRPLE